MGRGKRLWLSVGVAAVAAVAAAGAFGGSLSTLGTGPSGATSLGTSAASGSCPRATARQLVEQYRLNVFLLPNPISQLLCGPFTGPDSDAMAITIGASTCWGVQRWAVFRFIEGDWQLVLDRNAFIFPLVAVGADIRERTPVFRPGDPRCIPSGGSHARTWHWNGTRFTATAWKQVTPGTVTPPTGTSDYGFFKTPSGNILCSYAHRKSSASVECVVKSGLKPPPPRRRPDCSPTIVVRLGATGRVRTGGSVCPGEDAPETPYVGGGIARMLGYGKTWSGAGIRCASAVAGLTCRNKEGHGFFLSREKWRQF